MATCCSSSSVDLAIKRCPQGTQSHAAKQDKAAQCGRGGRQAQEAHDPIPLGMEIGVKVKGGSRLSSTQLPQSVIIINYPHYHTDVRHWKQNVMNYERSGIESGMQ